MYSVKSLTPNWMEQLAADEASMGTGFGGNRLEWNHCTCMIAAKVDNATLFGQSLHMRVAIVMLI